MNDICACGHIRDEHKSGFLAECEVEGCVCFMFDADENAKPEDVDHDCQPPPASVG